MPTELCYEVHEGDGPFLLLVHGMLSSRAQWDANLEALSTVSRPVVVELLGHGRSPSPEDAAAYHPDAVLDAFERIRHALGAERWVLCGQSFGATLTLRYALRFPERVIAQIFTNSVSALADPKRAQRIRRDSAALADAIEREGRAALERLPIHPRRAKRLPADAQQALVRDAALLDPAGIARTMRFGVPASSLHDEVAKLRVPTLLVCGERETGFERYRRYAERTMPQLEVVALDAGHAVNIEASMGFNEAVTQFIQRHAEGTAVYGS